MGQELPTVAQFLAPIHRSYSQSDIRETAAHFRKRNPLEPTQLAIQKLAEARNLLDLLITSSESFDYPMAKEALKKLNAMIRELSKVEAALQGSLNHGQDSRIVEFPRQSNAQRPG